MLRRANSAGEENVRNSRIPSLASATVNHGSSRNRAVAGRPAREVRQPVLLARDTRRWRRPCASIRAVARERRLVRQHRGAGGGIGFRGRSIEELREWPSWRSSVPPRMQLNRRGQGRREGHRSGSGDGQTCFRTNRWASRLPRGSRKEFGQDRDRRIGILDARMPRGSDCGYPPPLAVPSRDVRDPHGFQFQAHSMYSRLGTETRRPGALRSVGNVPNATWSPIGLRKRAEMELDRIVQPPRRPAVLGCDGRHHVASAIAARSAADIGHIDILGGKAEVAGEHERRTALHGQVEDPMPCLTAATTDPIEGDQKLVAARMRPSRHPSLNPTCDCATAP